MYDLSLFRLSVNHVTVQVPAFFNFIKIFNIHLTSRSCSCVSELTAVPLRNIWSSQQPQKNTFFNLIFFDTGVQSEAIQFCLIFFSFVYTAPNHKLLKVALCCEVKTLQQHKTSTIRRLTMREYLVKVERRNSLLTGRNCQDLDSGRTP